ncbi:MAG TPA: hypothetical protein VK504_17420 [Vicinamibacterales bacterium]|nr:hypothetical protein [Vicinamibacterales bacterium]
MIMKSSMKSQQKLCTKCGNEPRRRGQRWGKKCHAAQMRQQRASNAEVMALVAKIRKALRRAA